MSKPYSKVIIGTHVYLPLQECDDLLSQINDLRAERKYSGDLIKMYRMSKNWFGVPLYHYRNLKKLSNKIIDKRVTGRAVKFEFKRKLRPYQQEAFDQFSRLLKSGAFGFLIQAPPGFGKTVLLLKILATLQVTSLVVVPRSNLVKQWVKRILKFTDLPTSKIGIAMEGKCDFIGKKIVVGLVHSIALDRFGSDFKKYFGAVVFDEVDRSVPPRTFAPVCSMFPALYRIGASATFKRQDGAEVVFYKHFGQYLIRGKDGGRMPATIIMQQFAMSSGLIPDRLNTLQRRGMIISRLSENPMRNLMLCRMIELITNSDRRVIVVSDRTVQLATLRLMLLKRKDKNGLKSSDIGFYVRRLPILPTGKKIDSKTKLKYRAVKQKELDEVGANCKVILATYGMIAIGTDLPDIAGMVIATPQSETEQTRGRIERMVEGKQKPVVFDPVDTFYPDARRWADNRKQQYREKGLVIKQRSGGL